MLFIYPTPQYPRRPLEYVYKTMYLVTNIIHVVALVILISDFYTRLKDSMPTYFTKRELFISPTITMIMSNCTYTGELSLGSVKGEVEVGLGGIKIGLMNMAMYVQGLFITQFLLIFNHVICAFNYSTGNRHLRFFGVHVPYYHILVVFTYVYSIAIAVLTWVYESNRVFYHKALVYCADQLRQSNATLLDEAEYADYSIFTTAVYWPFAAVCFGMLVYLSAAVVLFVHSHDAATKLLSHADAPWEGTGFMCMTKKPYLKLHTAQRNAIIEDARAAIKEGEKVRIVRSYQLMTEEDFQTLVQAMKDQVARAIKEKQFEKLRENFGDRESQIDDMGFLWRQQMMPPQDPQTPGTVTGDQFYDVNFGDYFTDNEYNDNINANALGLNDGGPDVELDQLGEAPLDSPANLVEYNNDPLFPPDEDYGDMGVGAADPQGEGLAGAIGTAGGAEYYDENGNPYDENNDYDVGMGGAGDWGDEEAEGGGRVRHHHHKHRRRHSGHRTGEEDEGWGDDDEGQYYNDYDEPDPRSPGYDEYSPQEGGSTYGDYPAGSGAPRPLGRNKKRKTGGRQAEVEDDLADADALSDEGAGFY